MVEVTDIQVEGYERVVRGMDPTSGLHALIAVHDTTLGPALGGLRMWKYRNEDEAMTDVLRLARGMTYKSAVADTGLGGGKAVIVGNAGTDKSPALFRAMGELINALDGRYITAEDVGIKIEDLDGIAAVSRWVSGRSLANGGSGNPSPYTAHGVFVGLKACLEELHGVADFAGKRFAVQGIGAVAKPLCQAILERGGRIVACDVSEDNVRWAREHLAGVEIVAPEAIYDVACEVFVPCALGAVVNDETVDRFDTKIVAGCANNQLARPEHAQALADRGILYAPDYVINAGGIVNVSCEFQNGGYDESAALAKIENIDRALKEIFATAKAERITTSQAADRVAEKRLEEGRRLRRS